jgi:hypothetical protein
MNQLLAFEFDGQDVRTVTFANIAGKEDVEKVYTLAEAAE